MPQLPPTWAAGPALWAHPQFLTQQASNPSGTVSTTVWLSVFFPRCPGFLDFFIEPREGNSSENPRFGLVSCAPCHGGAIAPRSQKGQDEDCVHPKMCMYGHAQTFMISLFLSLFLLPSLPPPQGSSFKTDTESLFLAFLSFSTCIFYLQQWDSLCLLRHNYQTAKTHLLNMCISLVFRVFAIFQSHHQYLILGHVWHPRKKPCIRERHPEFSLITSWSQQPQIDLLTLYIHLFRTPHVRE